MEVQPQEGELGALVTSPEFARMVDRFAASTGLRLQVFDLDAHPLTPVEDYPRYCRLLQERKACPLYNDPNFLKRGEETIGVCKSGVGHRWRFPNQAVGSTQPGKQIVSGSIPRG